MSKRIFIIHRSEIIRQGLMTILRKYFHIEIIQLEKSDDLENYSGSKNGHFLFFIEAGTSSVKKIIYRLSTSNTTKTIALSNEFNIASAGDLALDETLALDVSETKIRQVTDEFFRILPKPSEEHEGEELTAREKEVLKLVALGHSNKEIAQKLFISTHTVISHRKNLTEKLGIKSISGLTIYAILNKLIDSDKIDPQTLI